MGLGFSFSGCFFSCTLSRMPSAFGFSPPVKPVTSGARLEVIGGVSKPPLLKTDRNRALWKVARDAGKELDLQLRDGLAGGASDGNTTSVHAPTLDGLGVVGGGAHAIHEFLKVDSLAERGSLLALLLLAPPIAWAEG